MSTLDVVSISIVSCMITSVFWYCIYYVPLWVDVERLKKESDIRLQHELEKKRNEWIENQNNSYNQHRNRLDKLREQSLLIEQSLNLKYNTDNK